MDRKPDLNGIDEFRVESEEYGPILELDYRFFEYMQEGVVVSSIIRDSSGKVVDLILKYANLVAYRQRKDLKGGLTDKSIKEIYLPEDAAIDIEKANEVINTNRGTKYEVYRANIDKYFSMSAFSPREDIYITFSTDISERKRAEERINAERQKLLDIIEFLPDATFVIDEERRVIAWNKAIEEMTGTPKAEIIGKGDYAYSIPFYGERRPIIIDLIFLSEEEIESKYTYVEREGETLFAEVFVNNLYGGKGAYIFVKASPLYDSKRNLVGSIENVRDITDQKRAEMALKASEEKFRSTIEQSTNGISIMDEHGKIIEWNKGMEIITGHKREEEIGKLLWDSQYELLAEEEKTHEIYSYIKNTTHEFLETGHVEWLNKPLTRKIQRPDGNVRYIESVTYPIKTETSTIMGSITRDITEQKEAEEALRESEERFRTLANNISQLVWMADENGQRFWYNKRWYDYTGTTLEEVKGKGWKKVHPPDDVEEIENKFNEGLKTRKAWEDTFLLKDKDGKYRWFLLRVTPIKDESGNVVRWFGTNTDIDELKKTEEALRESEERFRTLADNISQLVWMADENGQRFWYNKRWYDYTGTTLEEVKGKGWKKVHPPDDAQRIENKVNEGLKLGESWEDTFPLKGKDGKYRWFLLRVTPIKDESGNVVRWFGSDTDIGEFKNIEEKLRYQENLLNTILNNIPVAVFVAEAPSGKLIMANEQFENVWGQSFRPSENIEEYVVYKGFHPDETPYKPEEWPLARSITTGEVVRDEEITVLFKDGTRKVLSVSSTPIKDETGKVKWGVGIAADITELKKAEEN